MSILYYGGINMIKGISARELQEKIESGEKVNLIDVRESFELAQGKIPGVKHIPLGEIPDRYEELDKNEHYYLVCHSGARSGNACLYLTQLGYNVTNMDGGMLDWRGKIE